MPAGTYTQTEEGDPYKKLGAMLESLTQAFGPVIRELIHGKNKGDWGKTIQEAFGAYNKGSGFDFGSLGDLGTTNTATDQTGGGFAFKGKQGQDAKMSGDLQAGSEAFNSPGTTFRAGSAGPLETGKAGLNLDDMFGLGYSGSETDNFWSRLFGGQ